MSRYHRIPQTGHKKPDEFVSAVDHLLKFILLHKRFWLGGGILAVGMALALLITFPLLEKQKAQALNAQLALPEGDLKGAEEIAKRFAPFLTPVVELSHAQLSWQDGEVEKALGILDALMVKEGGIVGDYPRFLKAQILEKEGRVDEAKSLYQALADSEESELKAEAKARLSLIKTPTQS